MPITRRALLRAGYAEYDPLGAEGDPHCVGYFQKFLACGGLNVSFWRFPGVRGSQANFEILAKDRELQLDLGMRGVPKRWTVAELEAYVVALVDRVKRPTARTDPRAKKRSAAPKAVKRRRVVRTQVR